MPMNKFVFVADYFADRVTGGAELSTQAIVDLCPGEVIQIRSEEVSISKIDEHLDAYWIFTNVWLMKWGLIPYIVKKLKYSIVEYDYKYCTYRSPDIHLQSEQMPCNCTNIILDELFKGSQNIFFMSARQMGWHIEKMPFLQGHKAYVLSSMFANSTLDRLEELKSNQKEAGVFGIVFSRSSLKGFNEAVGHCEQKGINYRIFKDLSYDDLLIALSKCEGLIYKPKGGDTCPRVVIEAKLLGLKLDLNYFVQHKDENWFSGDVDTTIRHLRENKIFFWERIVESC